MSKSFFIFLVDTMAPCMFFVRPFTLKFSQPFHYAQMYICA